MKSSRAYEIVRKIVWCFSIFLLLLYPMRNVNIGVDLMDAGYNYANFRYNGLEYMDSMWFFATWLAGKAGQLLGFLPFADTMLGMNVYTSLFLGSIGAAAYIISVKKLKVPAALAFVCELVALSLCWAPTAVLYNYMTYAFLTAGIFCLYQGLTAANKNYLIAAGALLGLNIANRFSNLVEAGLILAVWYGGRLYHKKMSQIIRDTLFCVLGYVGAYGLFVALISLRYGLGSYVEGILNLFAMTEHATDYSAGYMLWSMFSEYYEATYWLKRIAVILVPGVLICLVLPKKLEKAGKVLTVIVTLLGLLWLKSMNYFYHDYASYDAMYSPAVIVLIMAMLLALWQLCSRNYTKEEKVQAAILFLVIPLSSIGSNNAMYSCINNMFLVLPCFGGMLWRFGKREKHRLCFPFLCILVMLFCSLVLQAVRFGQAFKYEEASGGRALDYRIEEIPVLKGMYTNEEKAVKLTQLYSYIQEADLSQRKCVLFGDIPGIAYYMELTPAVNVWSDLRSYDTDRMQAHLSQISWQDEALRPIVILEKKAVDYLQDGQAEKEAWEQTVQQKLQLLADIMEKYDYQQYFYNEKYAVFY